MVLSSPEEMMRSWCGWNKQPVTFWKCPRQVSTSQAFVSAKDQHDQSSLLLHMNLPLILHSLTSLSSPAETINGSVGWKATQLTPRSCPSRTNLTTASVFPKTSACAL